VASARGPRDAGARAARARRPGARRGRLDAGVEDHRDRPADARTTLRPPPVSGRSSAADLASGSAAAA
jgi:hypothetical protein